MLARPMNSPCSTTPGMASQRLRKTRRIRYAPKMGIHDPVAAIGDKNVTVAAFSDHYLAGNAAIGKRFFDQPPRRAEPKRNDLDRQRKAAERLDPFRLVGNHDHAVGSRRHDLFPQQGAAAALDEVERGVDLVGAVDGQVEPVDLVQRGQANAAADGDRRAWPRTSARRSRRARRAPARPTARRNAWRSSRCRGRASCRSARIRARAPPPGVSVHPSSRVDTLFRLNRSG